MNLRSLVARHHQSYNDRDLDASRAVLDEDVETSLVRSALRAARGAGR